MRATILAVAGLMVLGGAVLVRGQPERPAAPPAAGRTITVTGTGVATSMPDSARVTFAVTTRSDAVPDGRKRTAAAVQKVLAAVAALKLADVRTLTTGTSVHAARENKEPYALLGYDVWQGFTARIHRDDPDVLAADAERILDAGLANGATGDGAVYFFCRGEDDLRRAAQKKAVEDALEAARAYAAGAKLTVVEVVSIDADPQPERVNRGQVSEIIDRGLGVHRTFEAGKVGVSCSVRVVCRY